MENRTASARPTAEFQALSMVTAALLDVLDHRDRAVFGLSLLAKADALETRPLTDEDAQEAVAWVRALVAEIAKSAKQP